jgi:hypothetical protein
MNGVFIQAFDHMTFTHGNQCIRNVMMRTDLYN